MSELLSGVAAVPGVMASAIFDRDGACVESIMQPPYETVLLSQALDALNSAFEIYDATTADVASGVTDFVAQCDGGSLVLRRIAGYSVLAVAAASVNEAMLNVAFNVVVVKLTRAASGVVTPVAEPMATPSDPPPSNATVDTATLKALLHLYQRYMGPAAKVVLKQEMVRLGLRPRTLTREQFSGLIAPLAQRIQNAGWQGTFLEEAHVLEGAHK